MKRTRSQIRAAQIAELAAEQAAHDKSVNDAMKVAAFARCDAVEQLYELLDLKPERPISREGKNGAYEVATDKDEVKRSARLIEAVSALLAVTESYRTTYEPSDSGRGPDGAVAHAEAANDQRFAPASAGQLAALQRAG
ncbi:hypothetical protein [Microbacterium murale]|uniref:Terminase small subunit n=1 Tax=Microbacterium murale TaxID=1081040 RepID=A0ABQ1RPL6_9MICO|nr:hypothetical protein [Microbacterium murale]GGD76944.1 hypothetical protein GCM10007269_19860 [Microbacterium murale]